MAKQMLIWTVLGVLLAGMTLTLMPLESVPAPGRRKTIFALAALLAFHFTLLALYALQIVPPDGDFFPAQSGVRSGAIRPRGRSIMTVGLSPDSIQRNTFAR